MTTSKADTAALIEAGETAAVERLARQRAYHHYRDGANCAESVLRALPEALGRPDLEVEPSVAAAWAGGVADDGCLCGALAAAVMVSGVCAGRQHSARRARDKAARAMVGEIKKAFDERYGCSCCRAIRRKLDPESPSSTRYCADITAETAALAAGVLAACADPAVVRKRLSASEMSRSDEAGSTGTSPDVSRFGEAQPRPRLGFRSLVSRLGSFARRHSSGVAH